MIGTREPIGEEKKYQNKLVQSGSNGETTARCREQVVRKLNYAQEPAYFMQLTDDWDVEEHPSLWVLGNPNLLKCELLALYCSRKCPGSVIRKSHEFAAHLRRKGTPVIGGFQTQVEKLCLESLFHGTQPVVVCPARSIEAIRLTSRWRSRIDEGGLLLVSPFPFKHRRPTKETAWTRNLLVAAAAERIFFLHAAKDSNTFALALQLLSEGREIFTFDIEANKDLLEAGATHHFS